jgi:hypothetical protein
MFSHAISDIIIKFHLLFPHMPRKSLTLFHTFSHMLRKFAHLSTHAAEIRTLFRMHPHCMEYFLHPYEYEKALVSSYYLSHNNDRLERYNE